MMDGKEQFLDALKKRSDDDGFLALTYFVEGDIFEKCIEVAHKCHDAGINPHHYLWALMQYASMLVAHSAVTSMEWETTDDATVKAAIKLDMNRMLEVHLSERLAYHKKGRI